MLTEPVQFWTYMKRKGDCQTLIHVCGWQVAILIKHPLYQHSKLAIDLPDISHVGLIIYLFSCLYVFFVCMPWRLSETEDMRGFPLVQLNRGH